MNRRKFLTLGAASAATTALPPDAAPLRLAIYDMDSHTSLNLSDRDVVCGWVQRHLGRYESAFMLHLSGAQDWWRTVTVFERDSTGRVIRTDRTIREQPPAAMIATLRYPGKSPR